MLRRIARRLLAACSLAVGVSALLFLVFDSGLLGEPGTRAGSRGATARSVALTRLQSGLYAERRSDAVRLRLREGTHGRLVARGSGLVLLGAGGELLERLASPGGTVRSLLAGSRRIETVELPDEAGEWPAACLVDALALEPAALGAVPTGVACFRRAPALGRFLSQVGRLLIFDFGVPATSPQPIAEQLWERGRRSLALTLPAFLISSALAVFLALLAASLRGGLDRGLLLLSAAGMSVSSLVYILFLQHLLAFRWNWFPVHGWSAPYLPYLALPVLIWVVVSLGPDYRLYRTMVLEEHARGHVRTARAKGLPRWTVLRRHVLRNALVPILSQLGAALPFLFLGSLLLERFFGIPGLGGWTVEAVLSQDQPVLRATTFLFALIYLAAQWLTDLAYAFADPRMRTAT